ncbi:MAG TPA: phage scaffolding protein [Armatimonadota bacterium]|nr:phage scaffolding protein [Armatimonadota bacterium]
MPEEKVQGQVPSDESVGQGPNESGREPQGGSLQESEARGQEPESFDVEYVRKLRAEAAEYRKRLRELEAAVKKQEEAKLSETERLQQRLAELEREQAEWQRERQERTLKYEVMLAAGRLGIVDAEAAYKLLDLSTIEFDEDGNPTNIEKALRNLVSKRPYLVGGNTSSPTNPARSSQQPNTETEEQRRRRLMGGGTDIFDPNVARSLGGGVIFPKEKT